MLFKSSSIWHGIKDVFENTFLDTR